jgi:hypothetical protein
MAEADELKAAQALIAAGMREQALPALWKLYTSKDLNIKVEVGLALLVALDHFTQADKLLEVTDATIAAATTTGRLDARAYLLSKKAEFLSNKLSTLVYEQHNLKLAARVFRWIDFSLEEDKAEYERLGRERAKLEQEIASLRREALRAVDSSDDHYMRGHIFASLGEIAFSQCIDRRLDLVTSGRLVTKIANLYWSRRCHLDRLLGYDRKARKAIWASENDAIAFYKRAIREFEAGSRRGDAAFALHGLAVKYFLTYRFFRAGKYLRRAKQLAQAEGENALLIAVNDLEKELKNKYRHPRNYVEEFRMDLPRGLRKRP